MRLWAFDHSVVEAESSLQISGHHDSAGKIPRKGVQSRGEPASARLFQLAELGWHLFVLGDSSRLMTGAEQVIEAKFNTLSRREEEPSDRVLVAAERVGPLIVDSWEVVDL